jgi:hypothetical protein
MTCLSVVEPNTGIIASAPLPDVEGILTTDSVPDALLTKQEVVSSILNLGAPDLYSS